MVLRKSKHWSSIHLDKAHLIKGNVESTIKMIADGLNKIVDALGGGVWGDGIGLKNSKFSYGAFLLIHLK